MPRSLGEARWLSEELCLGPFRGEEPSTEIPGAAECDGALHGDSEVEPNNALKADARDTPHVEHGDGRAGEVRTAALLHDVGNEGLGRGVLPDVTGDEIGRKRCPGACGAEQGIVLFKRDAG